MSKATGLVGAVCAFGALAYLMAPLPPEAQLARPATIAAADTSDSVTAPPKVTPAAAPVGRAPAAAAQDPTVVLVRLLQTELLRLGCYGGAIDGRWTAESREAMRSLGERVRVLRPVDEPDYIMLALARSQESHICVPRGSATASRQPAQHLPMAGLVPAEAPVAFARESSLSMSAPVRSASPVPPRASARRDVGIVLGSAVERPAAPAATLPDREALERTRMSLGAAPSATMSGDAASPTITAAATQTRDDDSGHERTPARATPPPVSSAAPRAASQPRKRSWTRSVFSDLDRNGP